MKAKALNEDFLWKGKIQRARYPAPMQREPMDLPKYNTLTGTSHPENNTIHEKISKMSAMISRDYWFGERLRREAYRARMKIGGDV
jgi:hypothetical protein